MKGSSYKQVMTKWSFCMKWPSANESLYKELWAMWSSSWWMRNAGQWKDDSVEISFDQSWLENVCIASYASAFCFAISSRILQNMPSALGHRVKYLILNLHNASRNQTLKMKQWTLVSCSAAIEACQRLKCRLGLTRWLPLFKHLWQTCIYV